LAKNTLIKILYVEDEYITRLDVKNMISSKYKNVFTAKDGKDGFKLFKKERPDIVITDLKMPVLDGIGMTQKIREIDESVPIIVASAFEKEFIRFDNLNVFGYITKPITKFGLLIMIEDAILNEKNKS